jgi:hypothetical protein
MTNASAVADGQAAPRSTGEIISDAVDALRQTFPVVFSFCVPFCAVDLLLREVAQHLFLQASATLAEGRGADVGVVVGLLPAAAAACGATLGSFLVQQLLTTGVIAIGERVGRGQRATVTDALGLVVGRGAAVVATGALFLLAAIGLPVLAASIPLVAGAVLAFQLEQPLLMALAAVVAVPVSLVVVIVVTLRWALYGVIAATEPRALFAALRRSASLTSARGLSFTETPRFRLSVLFLIGLALAGTLQSLFVLPRVAIAVLHGWSFSDGALPGLAALPLWFMLPFGLFEVLTNAAVLPFSAFLLCFFTRDLRVRYEGDDLHISTSTSSPSTG